MFKNRILRNDLKIIIYHTGFIFINNFERLFVIIPRNNKNNYLIAMH